MSANSTVQAYAIIPAAGNGSRMESDLAKQYMHVNGKAVLQYAIESMLSDRRIKRVMVCLAEDDLQWGALPAANDSRVMVTQGGESRAESVQNGIAALSGLSTNEDWILVHDAARPCLQAESLAFLLDELWEHPNGGILAIPARDTLKLARMTDRSVTVEQTLDRSSIWQAQTPQMFRYEMLRSALQTAHAQGLTITDEASAIELAGYEVKLVTGEQSNLKVTVPGDLAIVESILGRVRDEEL